MYHEDVCPRHNCTKNSVSSTKSPGEEGYFETYYECPGCMGERKADESLVKVKKQWK